MIWILAHPMITYLITGSIGDLSLHCVFLFFPSQPEKIHFFVQKKPPDGPVTKLAAMVFIHIRCKTLLFVTVTAVGNENNNNEKNNQTYYLFQYQYGVFSSI